MIMVRELTEEEIKVIEAKHWAHRPVSGEIIWVFDALAFAHDLFEAARIQQTQER